MERRYTFDKKVFAERLKKARKDRSLTQEALADVLNVNVNTLAKWESPNNKLTLSYTNLMELANVLDIEIDYLFRTRANKDSAQSPQNFNALIEELTDKERSVVFNLIHSLIEIRK